MKASELRELSSEDLREKETELAEQLFVLRLQKVNLQLTNSAKFQHVRKDMARVLTVLNERKDS